MSPVRVMCAADGPHQSVDDDAPAHALALAADVFGVVVAVVRAIRGGELAGGGGVSRHARACESIVR